MDFLVRRDFERPFIEIRIAGPLSVEGSKERIARLVANENYQQGMNLLFDLRQAELYALDLNYMRSLNVPASRPAGQDAVSSSSSSSSSSSGRRVVFLVESEADELIMKLYKEMLEISPTAPDHDRRVFRDYGEAVAWVVGKAIPKLGRASGAGPDS